jgi:biopolymer transport protein ExbB
MSRLSPSFEFLVRGGIMMLPLAAAALVALAVILERTWVFRRAAGTSPEALLGRLRSTFARDGRSGALALLESERGALARVLLSGVRARNRTEAEEAMLDEGRTTLLELERGLPALDTIVTLAPLLGLLGTITGMMSSFQLLSATGVSHPSAITGGIAEALIATASGLVIAVVTLVFYNGFRARLQRIEAQLELYGDQALRILSGRSEARERLAPGGARSEAPGVAALDESDAV